MIYQIDVRGASSKPEDHSGTLEDPRATLYDRNGRQIAGASNDNSDDENNARFEYTPAVSASHYVEVNHADNTDTGTYCLSVTADRASSFASDGEVDVPENTTSATTVVAQDPDVRDAVTAYAIVGGEDQSHFNITSPAGVLSFTTAPDYENPADTNADNTYQVTVEATSGSAGLRFQQAIRVAIANDTDDSRTEAFDVRDITDLTGRRVHRLSLNTNDLVDYFKLTLTESKDLHITLSEQDANADIHLENSDGQTLNSSQEDGTADESLSTTLLAGTYYIRLTAQESGINRYTLRYSVSEPEANAIFTNSADVSVQETFRAVLTTVVAIDVDDDHEVTVYAVDGGADELWFNITSPGGDLTFFFVPDYEQPFDDDEDNVYEVVVKATSGPDDLTSFQTINVSPNPPKGYGGGVDTGDDGYGKANGPGPIPIDGVEGSGRWPRQWQGGGPQWRRPAKTARRHAGSGTGGLGWHEFAGQPQGLSGGRVGRRRRAVRLVGEWRALGPGRD